MNATSKSRRPALLPILVCNLHAHGLVSSGKHVVVQGIHGSCCMTGRAHTDEAIAFGPAGVMVHDDSTGHDWAKAAEKILCKETMSLV